MADGLGAAGANTALDSLWTTYAFVKLHIGAPGSAATAFAATETTRKQIVAPASASGGSKATAADLTWTSVAGSEDYTDFSVWTLVAAGVFGWSGSVTANSVTAGDTFTIASGSLTASFTVAS